LLFEADEPDHVEDISTTLDTKVDALCAHSSQFVTTHGIDPDDDHSRRRFADRVHDHARAVGARTGVEAGEVFRLMTSL